MTNEVPSVIETDHNLSQQLIAVRCKESLSQLAGEFLRKEKLNQCLAILRIGFNYLEYIILTPVMGSLEGDELAVN